MSAGRIALLVIGSILALVSLGLLAGGGVLAWAHATQRDDDGFYSTRFEQFESDGYAIRTDDLDIQLDGPDWLFEEGRLGTIRLAAESADPSEPLFLGIGPRTDVERYLDGVEHDVVADVEVDPFRVEYERRPGTSQPEPPGEQPFWAAVGERRLEWEVAEGNWVAVLMNADAARSVSADVSIAAKSDLVLWTALILLGLGLLLGALAALLIVLGARRAHVHAPPAPAPAAAPLAATGAAVMPGAAGAPLAAADVYPVQLEGELEPNLSRWLWLVKWLLLIPHLIVLVFLWAAFVVVTIVAFFAILFTERYPPGLFAFNVGVMRWTWRVSWYGYGGLGTDRYPPFTLADVDFPARLSVPYPERLSRGLVLVKWWLLAIPHYLVISFFLGPGWWWSDEWRGGPGLILLLVLFAAVVLLVRGSYPRSLYDLILGLDRWVARVVAYAALMRDEYPPFRLDR
jgi:hypothetical protein